MHGHIADRQKRDVLNRIVALLFALAILAERAGAMPAPVSRVLPLPDLTAKCVPPPDASGNTPPALVCGTG